MTMYDESLYRCKVFYAGRLEDALQELVDWLREDSGDEYHHPNSFYFSDLVESYDRETGEYYIDVWRIKMKGWMCTKCGHYESTEFHCSNCGCRPPWGCGCPACDAVEQKREEEWWNYLAEDEDFEFDE